MAIIKKLTPQNLERDTKHTEAESTYTIVTNEKGEKLLQIDTYGSSKRQIRGKKSQSIRFSREAITELREILAKEL